MIISIHYLGLRQDPHNKGYENEDDPSVEVEGAVDSKRAGNEGEHLEGEDHEDTRGRAGGTLNIMSNPDYSPTLQRARTLAGKSSEDMRSGIGWTPMLTEKTRMQAEKTLDQAITFLRWSKCQNTAWWERRRLVANMARLRMVEMAENR